MANKIKNSRAIARTPLRRDALAIAESGLAAIDTDRAVQNIVMVEGNRLVVGTEKFDLRKFRRIFVIGVGKCSLTAAASLEKILGKRITDGVVLDVRPGKLRRMRAFSGTHPLPTEKNIDHTREIVKLLTQSGKKDLVIFLVSGGGSVLLCQPGGFSCQDERSLMQSLFNAGADIHEMNVVRKHLSLARGGYLAKYAYPAKVVSLIFSDVPGDDLEFVASGPTFRDTTTVRDAIKILRRYDKTGESRFLEKELIETPKDRKYFRGVKNILAVSNRLALQAMAKTATELGYRVLIKMTHLQGRARAVAARVARDLRLTKPRTVLLYGGETTVLLRGRGRGGRNQEFSLAALPFIRQNELLLSVASDGWDNTKFAGGICDIITKERAKILKLDWKKYLRNNASFDFFRKTGQYLLTGKTGANVSDLIIAIKN